MAGWYGRQLEVSLSPLPASDPPVFETVLRAPEILIISSPVITSGDPTFSRQENLQWNADPANEEDVFIILDFSPEGYGNEAFSEHDGFANLIRTPDDGAYQFSPSDFGSIPLGATISIFVGRGKYARVTGSDGRHNYVAPYSLTAGLFRLAE